MNDALNFKCPVCGALPNGPCFRMDGTLMPGPHSQRSARAMGIVDMTRADRNQGTAPIVKQETEQK